MLTQRVRVFLLTFQRPQLLRRALLSLLAQTYPNWVCEVHNDEPGDFDVGRILAELAPRDSRFEYHQHSTNWGPVASFNHVFRGGTEPLAALLEDDNWWEPQFLRHMVDLIEANPDAALAWSNMRIWRQTPAGTWCDTGQRIWNSVEGNATPHIFKSPEVLQAFDALHSNGAMIFRPDRFRDRAVPLSTPFAIIEPARERSATGTLVFHPQPLGNFSITQDSARARDPVDWVHAKLLCAASFFAHVPTSDGMLAEVFEARRNRRPADTDIFFQLALVLREFRWVRFARPADWLRFIAHSARHPRRAIRCLRFRRVYPDTWRWLVEQTLFWQSDARATVTTKDSLAP